MESPFIYVTNRASVHEAVRFDNQLGVTYREVEGEHAIWAACVPFLPAMTSADFTRAGRQRSQLIQERQFRFLYDLARVRDHRATFELRFIATPNPVPGQPSLIDIVFLGKVFATREGSGGDFALRLWDKFASNFPLEDPFAYPLEPVISEAEFRRFYEPLSFDQLSAQNLLEIRKYEDMPIRSISPLGRVERKGDYVAHPFVPNVDFVSMSRFFAALAAQPEKCYAGVSLRPLRMFDQEVLNVSFAIAQFKRTASEDSDVSEEYIRTRSIVGAYVYEQMMQEREQLVMVRVYLVSRHRTPYGLAEALGSEMMGNVKNVYPTQWAAAQPADATEMKTALHNLRFLEQDTWGHTIAPLPLERLRYLATAREAYGAFRLPVPPESGYMAGVLVKDEPFVAPADELELRRQARTDEDDPQSRSKAAARQKKIELGTIYHRGNPTAQKFRLNVRDLVRHTLIAGSTGSGKSTTIKHLVSQLWSQHRVPFLVLYPVDKADYRDLRGFQAIAEDLLIFTLGDESTSPFRFNPFEVPAGLLLKTHLSRLMRVFGAAFTLQDPLPMVYREALRQVYRAHGWDIVQHRGDPARSYPVMSEFFQAIKEITDSLEYGREVKDNVRQASVIRIADLLENAGHVVNVRTSLPISRILEHPTIMELGRVGSQQDTALLMGFLLMRFAGEVERNTRPADWPHITVVEEAHRLMAETAPSPQGSSDTRAAAGEDFSNILAEVRGYGEGIVIAEQIPTLLVKGAIGNTYVKIMHWLEDAPSFELFGNVMNLSEEQQVYARTLLQGHAIVRSPYGRPVHIKVPGFGDQDGYVRPNDEDLADAAVRTYMQEQRQRLHLGDVPVLPWDASLVALPSAAKPGRSNAPLVHDGWRASTETLAWLLGAPMQTCAFCKAMHQSGQCKYRLVTRRRLLAGDTTSGEPRTTLERVLAGSDDGELAEQLAAVRNDIDKRLRGLGPEDRRGLLYCFLAHVVDGVLRDAMTVGQSNSVLCRNSRAVLQRFDTLFPSSA